MPALTRLLLVADDVLSLDATKARIHEAYPNHDMEIVTNASDVVVRALPGMYQVVVFDLHFLDASSVLNLAATISQHTPVLIWASTVTPEMTVGHPKIWTLPRAAEDRLPSVLRDMLAPAAQISRELSELRATLAGIVPVLDRAEQQHELIYKYLFHGNGTPSIVRQLESISSRLTMIESKHVELSEELKADRRLIWAGLTAVGTLVSCITAIIAWWRGER